MLIVWLEVPLPKQLRATIRGRVQGVCYRAWTEGEARALGLTGWVKNLPDGSVELLAQGEEVRLQTLLGRCRRGPPAAQVTHVEIQWEAAEEIFSAFTIQR